LEGVIGLTRLDEIPREFAFRWRKLLSGVEPSPVMIMRNDNLCGLAEDRAHDVPSTLRTLKDYLWVEVIIARWVQRRFPQHGEEWAYS
jgi:hypothetical protein